MRRGVIEGDLPASSRVSPVPGQVCPLFEPITGPETSAAPPDPPHRLAARGAGSGAGKHEGDVYAAHAGLVPPFLRLGPGRADAPERRRRGRVHPSGTVTSARARDHRHRAQGHDGVQPVPEPQLRPSAAARGRGLRGRVPGLRHVPRPPDRPRGRPCDARVAHDRALRPDQRANGRIGLARATPHQLAGPGWLEPRGGDPSHPEARRGRTRRHTPDRRQRDDGVVRPSLERRSLGPREPPGPHRSRSEDQDPRPRPRDGPAERDAHRRSGDPEPHAEPRREPDTEPGREPQPGPEPEPRAEPRSHPRPAESRPRSAHRRGPCGLRSRFVFERGRRDGDRSGSTP